MNKRILPLLLAAVLTLGPLAPAAAAAERGTVLVSSVSDLINLSKNCTLDTWSQGKTVRLTSDLNLTGCGFTGIPTFGGDFDGGGHTVSGLSLTAAGSHQGLFRYIQPSGSVRDLKVRGTVTPGGSASFVGGLAGINSGVISGCSFSGAVRGASNVGGLCGVNEATGRIAASSADGGVQGERAVGGLCGRNSGTLIGCTNLSSVNITAGASTLALEDMMGVSALNALSGTQSGADDAALTAWQDVGGVAGYTSGVVQSCVNLGNVGYPHMGYNIGGVAGRQSGYLAGCSNSGHIQGRKDVGGVAGQCEPYVVMDADGDTLQRLRSALDRLSGMIDGAITHADDAGDNISSQLTALGDTTENARNSAKELSHRTETLLNSNIDAVNDLSVSISNALDQIAPAMDDLSAASDGFADLSADLKPVLEELAASGRYAGAAMSQLSAAAADLQSAAAKARTATEQLRTAIAALRRAVVVSDQAAMDQALNDLGVGVDNMNSALRDASAALARLATALGTSDASDLADAFSEVGAALSSLSGAGTSVSAAISDIQGNLNIDSAQLNEGLALLERAMGDLSASAADLQNSMSHLKSAVSELSGASGQLADALEKLKAAASSGESAARRMGSAFERIKNAADQLRKNGAVTFTPVDNGYRDAGDRLFDDLSDLSGNMESLNAAVSTASDTLSRDLRAINGQFNLVMNLLLDAVDELQGGGGDSGDDLPARHLEDVSDEDIAATTLGKTAGCSNRGRVEADRNVGGIVGAVGIEFDLDPEDDSSLSFSYTATYKSKAVVTDCVNRGETVGKKDCIGGIAGRVDLGVVDACQNYGAVTSSDGDYVGGVAGASAAILRQSYAKCTLSGGSYIGGVAGSAGKIDHCAAIPTLSGGEEYLGSIAGYADDLSELTGNLFLDTGVGGVDSISYDGCAQPAAYEALRSIPGVPAEFAAFTLTLTADGKTVDAIPFLYGADLSRIQLPAVPEKAGHFGVWPSFDSDGIHSDVTLEAVYAPYITVVASDETDGGLPLALAEGSFTDEVVLRVSPSPIAPPSGADAQAWDVTLTGSGSSETGAVPLRLLCRSGGSVYQFRNGAWQSVPSQRNGSYLITEMSGLSCTFCVRSDTSNTAVTAVCAGGVAGLAALAFLLSRRKKCPSGVRGKKKLKQQVK